MRKFLRLLACHIGFHTMEKDPSPVNGVWWAFCSHCGARHAGTYDPAYGRTFWERR